MATLTISASSGDSHEFTLEEDHIIGRQSELASDSSRIGLLDEEVSRRHARLQRRGNDYFVEDLASTNGTILRGKRLIPHTPYRLLEGDTIEAGAYKLQYHRSEFNASMRLPGYGKSRSIKVVTADDETNPTRHLAIDAAAFSLDAKRAKKLSEEELQTSLNRLQAISRISMLLGTLTDHETLMRRLMDYIFDIFPQAERAFVMLKMADREELVPVTIRDKSQDESRAEVTVSRSIIKEVTESKRAVLSIDAMGDDRFSHHESIINLSLRSLICAPLLVEEEVIGLIQVEIFSSSQFFSEEDLNILIGITNQAAIAIKNNMLYEEIEQLLEGFIRASVQAIEARDPTTAGHSFRVAEYTENLARAVDSSEVRALKKVAFNRDELQEIRYAALLHDFGKVGVRENVLNKAKKIFPDRLELIRERFKVARIGLERQLYRDLVEDHATNSLSTEEFERRRQALATRIEVESGQLEAFLSAIINANEPTISEAEAEATLTLIREAGFQDEAGEIRPLLYEFEFEDLSLEKGTLNSGERSEIESHVSHTFDFLSLIPWSRKLQRLPDITFAHHEKLDGSGYPRGLSAAEIPVQTRILTIADIFDALTAGDRPYKSGLESEAALDILEGEVRSKKIDADLFKIFVDARAFEINSRE